MSFLSSIFGSGGTSSVSTTTTQQYDQRVAADGSGIAVGQGASLSIDATTPEAWRAANDLITESGFIADKSFQFAGDVGRASLDMVRASEASVLDFLNSRTQSEGATLAQDALKFLVPIAIAAIVVAGLKGFKV